MRLVALLLIPCLAVPQAMSAGGKPFTASYTWSAACPSFNDQALACNPVLSSRNLLDGVRKIVRRRVTRQLISAGQAQLVQPVVAVFDVHGTLLQPNWKDSQILAYQKLTGADDGAARAWVDANTLNLSNDELIRRMADASGKPEAEARRWFNWAREHIERNFIPEPIPGALDLIKTLHDRGVPIVILSGGAHATVVRQLSKGGFLKYIPENRILGRDDVMRSVLGEPYSVEHRKNALRSIARQFPGHRLLSFDDWTDNIETVNELGGTTIAIPQGEGEDRRTNETILREKGAQFFVSDWREAAARLGEWGVPDHQPPEQRIPTLLKPGCGRHRRVRPGYQNSSCPHLG